MLIQRKESRASRALSQDESKRASAPSSVYFASGPFLVPRPPSAFRLVSLFQFSGIGSGGQEKSCLLILLNYAPPND